MDTKKPNSFFRSTIRLLLFIVCSIFLTNTYAQYSNKLVKANNLYKAKRYAEAIPIYEQIIEQDFNKSALLKLAKSHRQINNLSEALENYRILMQQPEVKNDHKLDFVELLIMNGNYLEAKKSLAEVKSLESTIHEIFRLNGMINNHYNLSPLYDSVYIESFAHNTALTDENSPYFLNDKIIFTSDQSTKTNVKKKSGLTGRAFYKVWESTMNGEAYSNPKPLGNSVNASNKNTANAFFDLKNKEVLFTKNDNTRDRKNFYNMQLYSSKIKNGNFGKAQKLPFCSSEFNFMHPCLSKDGKVLLFVSDRPGEGGTDIFMAKRTKDGWSRARNIGETINTVANEGFPFLDEDGNLYFCSKGHSGLGGYDIFLSKKEIDGSWGKPVNLGRPFNSQHDDISIYFKAKDQKGAFTSSRNGSDDIFLFEIK